MPLSDMSCQSFAAPTFADAAEMPASHIAGPSMYSASGTMYARENIEMNP